MVLTVNSKITAESACFPGYNSLEKPTSVSENVIAAQKEAKLLPLIMAALVSLIPSFSIGTAKAFSTTAVKIFRENNTTSLLEPLNDTEMSWISTVF
jgi:hypothetical protein